MHLIVFAFCFENVCCIHCFDSSQHTPNGNINAEANCKTASLRRKNFAEAKEFLFLKKKLVIFHTKSAVVNSVSFVISTYVENLYTASHFFSFAVCKKCF